jgi:hypothetical protein
VLPLVTHTHPQAGDLRGLSEILEDSGYVLATGHKATGQEYQIYVVITFHKPIMSVDGSTAIAPVASLGHSSSPIS